MAGLRIYSRAEWGARYAAGFGVAPTATEVWLHHTVMPSPGPDATLAQDIAAMRAIESVGQSRFGKGVSYTHVVMESARIMEGTGPGRVGSHTGGRNTRARAICLNGNYDKTPPNAAMLASIVALLIHGKGRRGWWALARLDGGHQDAPGASTACPGRAARALIPALNISAASGGDPAAVNQEDEMALDVNDVVGAVRVGLSQMFDEAANRHTPTGRNFGDDLAIIIASANPSPKALASLVASQVQREDLDPAQVAAAVAASLPDDVAQQVAAALSQRLAE